MCFIHYKEEKGSTENGASTVLLALDRLEAGWSGIQGQPQMYKFETVVGCMTPWF